MIFPWMVTLFDIKPPYLVSRIFPAFGEQSDWMSLQYSHLIRPVSTDRNYLKLWLARSIEELDLRATTLAKLAGIAPSTLNRFLDQKEENASLTARTITKISKVFSEEVSRLARLDWKKIESESSGAEACECSLLGRVREDEWQHRLTPDEESDERGAYSVFTVPVIFPYVRHSMACFEVSTGVHDPVFQMHDTLFCSPIALTKILPVPEQIVVLLEAGPKKTFRSFLRRYVKDPTGREWLVPIGSLANRSTSAILIDDAARQAENFKISFTVVGMHSHMPPGTDLPLPIP